MRKITTLLMLLIIAISGSAKSTAFAPDARVGAGELRTGRNYMIFNTAYTPGSFSNRWGAAFYVKTTGAIRLYGGAVPETFTTEDQNYLFQLALNNENVLLSIGANETVGRSFTFTPWEEATEGKSSAQSRNDDGTFTANADISAANKVWLIHDGEAYWNGNNWTAEGANSFATWSTGHPYAIYTVKQVTTVTVSYILCEENGEEVWTEEVEQAANSAVQIPASMQGNLYSLSTEGTIGDDDCEIIVTRIPNFSFDPTVEFGRLVVKNDVTATETSSITEGQWYMLTQVRGSETPAYDTGAGNTLKRAANAVSITQGTDPNSISEYLVRFFDADTGDGKYIQFATGNFWNGVKSSASTATMFLVYPATHTTGYSGWAINYTSDGTTYENIVDNNGPDKTVAYWESGRVTTGTNNVWKLYPVDLIDPSAATSVTLTYKIVDSNNNTLVENAGTVTAYVGEALPTVPAEYVNDFVSYTYRVQVVNNGVVGFAKDPTVVPSRDATVIAKATYNLPFELTDEQTIEEQSMDDANLYYMTLRGKFCLTNEAQYSMQEAFDRLHKNSGTDLLYSFSGNPVTGISVYNWVWGYMSVGSETDNSVAEFDDNTPTYFTIKANSNETNGFNLNVRGTDAYINLRNGYVSTWLSANANNEVGSCLVAYTDEEVLSQLIDNLGAYYEVADVVGGLSTTYIMRNEQFYNQLKANPTATDYISLKKQIDENLIPLTVGKYYTIRSAYPNFYDQQGTYKVLFADASDSSVKLKWHGEGLTPAHEVFQVVDKGNDHNVLYNPMTNVYLVNSSGESTNNSNYGSAFTLTPLGGAQQNIILANGSAPLHTKGHSSGAGESGELTNWAGGFNSASAWYIIPADIEEIELIKPEGVADGEKVVQGFAHTKDAQLPANMEVYTIIEETNAGVQLNKITNNQLAAGQGYIISGVKGATVPLLPVAAAVEAPAGNLLVAGDGSIANGGLTLAYKDSESEAKFWSVKGQSVPANSSYLPESTTTDGLEDIFGGIGEDITGISGVTTGNESGAVYDLQGRRVNNTTKGVYIINGKKVIK